MAEKTPEKPVEKKVTLKTGDLVELKSGVVRMTVIEKAETPFGSEPGEYYRCKWFNSNKTLKDDVFPIAALKKIDLAKKEL